MKEFVTANGRIFECVNITTGLDSIMLTMENQDANDLLVAFGDVSELTVSFEKQKESLEEGFGLDLEEPHGVYENLKLESVSTNVENETVSVTMHIKSKIEIRLDRLEEVQEIQNGAIDELAAMQGGENQW